MTEYTCAHDVSRSSVEVFNVTEICLPYKGRQSTQSCIPEGENLTEIPLFIFFI